jgi:hemoglobin-like flavoprotein
MTEKQIELVESSWEYVLLNTNDAGAIFYDRLFSIDPSLKPLFKENIKVQSQKLISMITFVVHKLSNLQDVVKDVIALGKRHKNYKVKPEHYAIVAQALLWTLEKGAGEKWTNEHKEAWVAAYTILSQTMIQAAKEA